MADYERTLTDREAIDTVWDLAASIDFCMFITWDGKRQRARPLSARPDRDLGRIYFLTDARGAKDEQIERFPKVTMAWADIRSHDYVVITGDAIVSDDRARIAELWTPADQAWWDGPDDPNIRLITVDPHDAELWKGPNRLIAGAKMLAAAVTGAEPDLGENVKLDHL
jgi:general stress protein 26